MRFTTVQIIEIILLVASIVWWAHYAYSAEGAYAFAKANPEMWPAISSFYVIMVIFWALVDMTLVLGYLIPKLI